MLKFFIFNYRGIFHVICMIEFIIISWLFGLKEVYELNPQTVPIKIFFLILNYFVAEWSLKKSGIKELCETEKKKI